MLASAADLLKKGVKQVSQATTRQSPLEKNLSEATQNTNWGCPTSVLMEIARQTYDFQEYQAIMKHCWEAVNEKNPTKWRRIYKGLTMLEFLCKNGSERCVDESRESLHRIRMLMDFHVTEEGRDKGAGIREKSKYICELINDSEMLKQEREKARQNRDKYIGIGAGGQRTGAGWSYNTATPADRTGGRGMEDRPRDGNSASPYDPYIPKADRDKEKEKEKRSSTDKDADRRRDRRASDDRRGREREREKEREKKRERETGRHSDMQTGR
mmetsp:Transcript_48364/g.95451  ORF Transcript_48364/g.95451 Transcript_48364/m.95451 type:complete len:270 (-) Transcript_48364:150-959(-)